MSHGIHEEKHVRYALMYSGLSRQVCEGAGVYEGNEDVQGYVVVPVTERSRGDLHAATGTCSPSLLLVFCALSFALRRPSRFHGDTVSPVTQAHDLGDIINSPFLPRPVQALGTCSKITSPIQPERNAKRKRPWDLVTLEKRKSRKRLKMILLREGGGCRAGSRNSGVCERVYRECARMCADASWQDPCAAGGMTFLTRCDKAHSSDLFSYSLNMYPTGKTVFIVTDPKPIIFF